MPTKKSKSTYTAASRRAQRAAAKRAKKTATKVPKPVAVSQVPKPPKPPRQKVPVRTVFARTYAFGAAAILLGSTAFWSWLSARIQQGNADQLVDTLLFNNRQVLHGAQFPGAHSQLFKWPILASMHLFGNTPQTYIGFTIGVAMLTIGLLAIMLLKVERRPLVFGTLCLVLSSTLLVVPAQPYPGALLPANMAMLTTRNLEYIVYIVALFLLVRPNRLWSWRFAAGSVVLGLLVASDKLFLSLSILGSLMGLILYALGRKWTLVSLSVRWLVASALSAVMAAGIIAAVNLSHLTTIVNGSGVSPYGFTHTTKALVQGIAYALTGLLANFGIVPAGDTRLLRTVPHQTLQTVHSWGVVPLVCNSLLLLAGLWAVYRLLTSSLGLVRRKQNTLAIDDAAKVSLMLIASSIAAIGVFIGSNHYYPVDMRYVSVSVFAVFLSLAVYSRKKRWPKRAIIVLNIVLLASIGAGVPTALHAYHASQNASADIAGRNARIADVLRGHPVNVLLGDYWRVMPIKIRSKQMGLRVNPLSSCTAPQTQLSSKAWNASLNHRSFAYILTLEKGPAGTPACSLDQVHRAYGEPNSSVLIAGTPDHPKEVLLFFDQGIHAYHPHPAKAQPLNQIVPIPLSELIQATCTQPTVLNVVAHEDDDILFMNPDLMHSIKEGDCVRTIYVTAGDDGSGSYYWLGRQRGIEAAYATALDMPNNIWEKHTVRLAANTFISVESPRGNPRVSLIFMNLPDGDLRGTGFKATHFESLAKLRAGRIKVIHAVDSEATYTSDQLIGTLTTLMFTYHATEVRTQALVSPHNSPFPDHSDHMTVGYFTQQAYHNYVHGQLIGSGSDDLKYYVGYPIHDMPANVTGPDLATKTALFLTYAKYDGAVCETLGPTGACGLSATYQAYLERQYQAHY